VKCFALAILLCATAGSCSRPDDQKTDSIGKEDANAARSELSASARAQLDSGNIAYRAKSYDRARAHYERVTQIDKDAPAGWFGIYMTEQARGNAAAADSALRRVQKQAPGATLVHPKTTTGS
jgi:hypothetical protein